MRLPHSLIESPFFSFSSLEELTRAMGAQLADQERAEMQRLCVMGLPPVTSTAALATLIGLNQGIIWSFISRPRKHYRRFTIPKGRSFRQIVAPRIGLKIIQKWMAYHLAKFYQAPDHVYGFVPGKSHVKAAKHHLESDWILSIDISDFFPSTPAELVKSALVNCGYSDDSSSILSKLFCVDGGLAQGAPTSPVVSNICFETIDAALVKISTHYGVRVTRYADDIVFSGVGEVPDSLSSEVEALLRETPWKIATQKTEILVRPQRLKVHGLLVSGERVRLTKGYRNRLRAYRHLLSTRADIPQEDARRMKGHVAYGDHVEAISRIDEGGPRKSKEGANEKA